MEKNSTTSVLDRVREVISSEEGVSLDEVTPSTVLSSLAVDSLELLGLMIALEIEFRVEIEREDLKQILTVGDAAKFIEAHKR
jgi:acyl carrier protein